MSSKKTILLVEDEAVIALSRRMSLQDQGFSVLAAMDGESALQTFREHQEIDLVLMDVDLGNGIDGTETATRMLDERDIPVVFLSAHTDPEMVNRTENISSCGYVVKHTGDVVLLAAIRMAFRLHEAQRRERESVERLRMITDNMNEVFWLRSADNRKMLYINPVYEKIWGRSCESLYSHPESYIDTIHELDRERILSAMETYRITGTYDEEFRIIRPNGMIRWIRARSVPVRDEAGNVVSHAGSAVDITDRKRFENELMIKHKVFSSMCESVTDVVWSATWPDPVFLYISPSAEQVFGLPRHELLTDGRRWLEMVHEGDRDRVEQMVREVREIGSCKQLFRLVRPDDSIVWVQVSCRLIRNDENVPFRVSGNLVLVDEAGGCMY